ncbi:hypothetical protein WMY93_010113 [Mugilogobius chulae]|uniref:Ion transport domain-containing protein n=1 Tax=Mugilogobius chulae TaxID=88201 RepID=A0AAW0PFH3_9GOBI
MAAPELAQSYFPSPQALTELITVSHVVFSVVFFAEMVLKLVAYSTDYFRNRTNILEFLIAIVGVCEIATFTDFSTILRLIRLIVFVPYLKSQLLMLEKTIEETLTLCGLILLFVFTFR